MPSYIDSDGTKVRNGKRLTARSELLTEAERIVTQDRNKSYGEPDEHFQHVAKIANALGFRIDTGDGEIRELRGSDHTLYMLAVKLSRLMVGNMQHRDSWLDIAGYAACGFETGQLEAVRADSALLTTMVGDEEAKGQRLDDEVRELADKALSGDPSDLENRGLFLKDLDKLCWSVCVNNQVYSHSYVGGCRYRVTKRRNDG